MIWRAHTQTVCFGYIHSGLSHSFGLINRKNYTVMYSVILSKKHMRRDCWLWLSPSDEKSEKKTDHIFINNKHSHLKWNHIASQRDETISDSDVQTRNTQTLQFNSAWYKWLLFHSRSWVDILISAPWSIYSLRAQFFKFKFKLFFRV